MRVFKNAWFERFALKRGITDKVLLETIRRAEQGLIDANLGGGVIKQRIARQGQGKSAGFRTIILYRATEHAFFVYGFSKNDRGNLSQAEETEFRKAASHVLGLSNKHLTELIDRGQFIEVRGNGEELPG
jgi:hypothetical protein